MLQGEHSAILPAFFKLKFVIKTFVLSILSGRFTQVLLYFDTASFQSQVSTTVKHLLVTASKIGDF